VPESAEPDFSSPPTLDAGNVTDAGVSDAVPPMLPSRNAFLLAFAGVVVAGIFGGVIGFGIADLGSHSDTSRLVGTFIGSIAGAGGVAIVAVLVLRAMSEWKRAR